MKAVFQSAFLAIFACAVAACSNPFSSKQDQGTLYHTPNTHCQNIRFDDARFDTKQLRNLVHCLNSDQEIQAFENWLDAIPNHELDALSEWIDLLLNENVGSLYAIHSGYLNLKSKQQLDPILAELSRWTGDTKRNLVIGQTIAEFAPWISDFIFDPQTNVQTANLKVYLQSKSFARLQNEHTIADLGPLIRSLHQYLKSTDGFSIQNLGALLDRSKIRLTQDPKKLTSISSFFDSVFNQKLFAGFSSSIELATQKQADCFYGTKEIKNPIPIILNRLDSASARDARVFFNSTLRSLVMTARGYCNLPYSVEPVFRFTDPLIFHSGFESSYELLKPLIRDPAFIQFLSQKATRDWMSQNAFLAKDHTLQDLFVLLALYPSTPVSKSGSSLSKHLDSLFSDHTPEQLIRATELIAPFFQNVGQTPFIDGLSSLPELRLTFSPASSEKMRRFLPVALKNEKFIPVLDLLHRLIEQKKLLPLVDQIFAFYQRTVERGRHDLIYPTPVKLSQTMRLLQNTQIEKTADRPRALSACSFIDSDLYFTHPALQVTSSWQKLEACFGPLAKEGKAVRSMFQSSGKLSDVLAWQSSLIQTAFKVDSQSAMNLVSAFIDVSTQDSKSLHESALIGSKSVSIFKGPVLKKPALRSIFADAVADPKLYQGLVELQGEQKPSRADVLTLSASALLPQLSNQVKEFCASLDIGDHDCDLDDDQVLLYKQNPLALAEQIIQETKESSQSWMHPVLSSGWKHALSSGTNQATRVEQFPYHFYPFIHELRSSKNATRSIFRFFNQYATSPQNLKKFIDIHARAYSLVPYFFQVPHYPEKSKREFHSRIRIRLLSDLDRLELIAINTDFRAFGLSKNLGMRFIRDIALSWGDETNRPAMATQTKLADTATQIRRELERFDRKIIQDLGHCDPRGKTRVGRWIQSSLCNAEIADLSARLFNLRSLIGLLDKMLPLENGGNDGLRVLRNLFYSLYVGNPARQSDHFGNGADVPSVCLTTPDQPITPEACKLDHLTFISRITRLGLLHQIGLSIAFNPHSSVQNVVPALVEVSKNEPLVDQLATWAASPSGPTTLLSIHNWVQRLPEHASSEHYHYALKIISQLQPFNWVSGFVLAAQNDPRIVESYSAPLIAWITRPNSGHQSTKTPLETAPAFTAWIQTHLGRFHADANKELGELMLDLRSQKSELVELIQLIRDHQPIESKKIRQETNRWLLQFAQDKSKPDRERLSRFLQSKEFDSFCDVYSDAATVSKTYRFLESIHQNPDATSFFETCRDFLFR